MARPATSTTPAALDENTTKSHADNVYERLVAAHATIDTISGHLYGDPEPDLCEPIGAGIHGTIQECDRLSRLLCERLDGLWGRL